MNMKWIFLRKQLIKRHRRESKMKGIKTIKECEIPDVAEFLKLSRSLIRQISLIKDMKTSKAYQEIIRKASVRVSKELEKFTKENSSEGPM